MRSLFRSALIVASLVMMSASRHPVHAVPTQWTSIGPTNVEGRVTAVGLHPTNPNIILAAGETGGIFRSTDGGTNWELGPNGQSSADELPDLAVADLQFVPNDPEPTIAFAGAGQGKLYKSTDSGATWPGGANIVTLPDGGQVDRIRIDPGNSQKMYAVEQGSLGGLGVYKSINGGGLWTKTLTSTTAGAAGRNDLAIDYSHPQTLYATLSGAGVFKSTNSGTTWNPINTTGSGLPTEFNEGSVAVAPTDSKVVYATVLHPTNPLLNGFYRSGNSGKDWTLQSRTDSTGALLPCCFGEIVVDPTNANIVYYSHFHGLFKSENGGVTFYRKPQNHVDQQSFAIQPGNPQILWAGNDGGLEKSTNQAATGSPADWTPISKLPITQFYDLDVQPYNSSRVIGGSQDNGVSRYTGSVNNWDDMATCGDASGVVIDPVNPNRVVAQCYYLGFDESLSGGAPNTWRWASSGLDMTSGLFKSQTGVWRGAENTYYSGGDRVHKSRTINPTAGFMQHYFMNAEPLTIPTGGTIRQWVYVPSDAQPTEIMLQFRAIDGSYDHRAYWSATASNNPIGFPGAYQGSIPAVDHWAELVVAASDLGLAGQQVDGLSYMIYNGSTHWDHTAVKDAAGTETVWVEDDVPRMAGSPDTPALTFASPPDVWAWQTGWPDNERIPFGRKAHASNPTWVPITPVLQPGSGGESSSGITAIASSRTNQGRLYVALGHHLSGYGADIWRIDGDGASRAHITSPAPGELITAIAVDPVDDKVVYVTTGARAVPWSPLSHVWKTEDATADLTGGVVSWLPIAASLPDAPYNDIVISPTDRRRVVIVNGIGGVYDSPDGGMTWPEAGDFNSLPNTIISGVALECGVDLTISTYGRGMWRLPGSKPSNDTDGDGFSDCAEQYMGTIINSACPATSAADDEPIDSWPPDFTDDRFVDISDQSRFSTQRQGAGRGDPDYNPRYDLNADGFIDISDQAILSNLFGQMCS